MARDCGLDVEQLGCCDTSGKMGLKVPKTLIPVKYNIHPSMDGSRYLKIVLEPVFDCSLKMFKKVSAMIFGDGKQLQYTHTDVKTWIECVCVCVTQK